MLVIAIRASFMKTVRSCSCAKSTHVHQLRLLITVTPVFVSYVLVSMMLFSDLDDMVCVRCELFDKMLMCVVVWRFHIGCSDTILSDERRLSAGYIAVSAVELIAWNEAIRTAL